MIGYGNKIIAHNAVAVKSRHFLQGVMAAGAFDCMGVDIPLEPDAAGAIGVDYSHVPILPFYGADHNPRNKILLDKWIKTKHGEAGNHHHAVFD